MKSEIKIYDDKGDQINVLNVIKDFLYEQANINEIPVDDVLIGIELILPIRNDGKNILELIDVDFNLIDSVIL